MIRFMKLVDSVLPLLTPRWEYSQATFTSLEVNKLTRTELVLSDVTCRYFCNSLLLSYLVDKWQLIFTRKVLSC